MLVLLRKKETGEKTYIKMAQMTITPDNDGTSRLNGMDINNRKFLIKNIPNDVIEDIEMRILQDFVIDLTPYFEGTKDFI